MSMQHYYGPSYSSINPSNRAKIYSNFFLNCSVIARILKFKLSGELNFHLLIEAYEEISKIIFSLLTGQELEQQKQIKGMPNFCIFTEQRQQAHASKNAVRFNVNWSLKLFRLNEDRNGPKIQRKNVHTKFRKSPFDGFEQLFGYV